MDLPLGSYAENSIVVGSRGIFSKFWSVNFVFLRFGLENDGLERSRRSVSFPPILVPRSRRGADLSSNIIIFSRLLRPRLLKFKRKLFALRDTRRGTWRQALGGLEAQMDGGSEARGL